MGFAELKVWDLWDINKLDNIYYLYGLFRPDKPDKFGNYDSEPFYFGKGSGNRLSDHRREANFLKNKEIDIKNNPRIKIIHDLWGRGLDFEERKLVENLKEQETLDLETELILKYGRINNGTGCLANLTNGGEIGAGWFRSKEEILEDLKEIYGEVAHDMIVNYIYDPLITQTDIAEFMGTSKERIRCILNRIYDGNAKKLQDKNKVNNKSSCYPSNLQGIVGDKLRKEGIRYRKKNGTVWECENGKTFTVHKLSLHKKSGLYTLNWTVTSDYIITYKYDNVYIVPFPNSDVDRIYLHYPQDLEQYKDFFCLKNLDLDGNEKESICRLECKEEPNKYIFGHMKNKLSEMDIANMILKYNRGVSMYELGKKYNVSVATVRYHLEKNDIEIRPLVYKGTKKGRKFSCKEKEFVCSICEKVFIKKRKPKEMICSDCRKIQK